MKSVVYFVDIFTAINCKIDTIKYFLYNIFSINIEKDFNVKLFENIYYKPLKRKNEMNEKV